MPADAIGLVMENGAQAEFQALALKRVCGIDTVRLFDTDPAVIVCNGAPKIDIRKEISVVSAAGPWT